MPLRRVERDPRAVAHGCGDLLQPRDPAFQRAARVDRAQPVERIGERPGSVDKRQVGIAADRLQPARILGIEFAPDRIGLFLVQREWPCGQRGDEVGQREID